MTRMRELAGAATLAVVTTACASGASGDEAIPVEPAVESTVETTTALES